MDIKDLPFEIDGGEWAATGHVQGVAICPERNFACFSFTTVLVKTDLQGKLIGTVGGLVGHLGCIDYSAEDGQVWGSLEYKNDAIGKGIFKTLGKEDDAPAENAFYAVCFDVGKIDRVGMDAERDGIMRAVYLPDVVEDYAATGERGLQHRFACSGIDGTAFGPVFGAGRDSERALMIAYGIYGDTDRADNDHQIILQYDPKALRDAARPLCQTAPHHDGIRAAARYFFYTGNTTYGVQNLCYDPTAHRWMAAVYRGKKPQFPNYAMYLIDGAKAPVEGALAGLDGAKGLLLSADDFGILDEASGVRGLEFPLGATGMHALGDGLFYFVEAAKRVGEVSIYSGRARLWRATDDPANPFVAVTDTENE